VRLLDDLKYAVRGFTRSKVTAAILLVSLALGTGANAVLYSAMDGLLFRPPAGVADSSQLVTIFTSQYNGGSTGASSYPDFQTLETDSRALTSLAAFDDSTFASVRLGDAMQRVRAAAVSDRFFSTLGLTAHEGTLHSTDARSPLPPWAILSFALWTMFGSPTDILGQSLQINGREHIVAGIAPERFEGLQLNRPVHVWIPLGAADRARGRGDRRLSMLGRLATGSSRADAQAEVERISTGLADRFPETNRGTLTDPQAPRLMTAVSYSRLDPSSRKQVILISVVVFGATGLLLLSACVNAGSLLLSRSAARRRELAVKIALGANRRLLVRQVVVESMMVSLAGAGLGLLFAHWTAGILPAQFAPEEAGLLDRSLDTAAVGLTVAFSCLVGCLFAIGPARHATETVDTDVLRADAGGITTRGGYSRFRTIVITGLVALSTLLLIAAGLLVQTLSVALEGELGPDSRDVAIAFVRVPGIRQEDVARGIRFHTGAGQMAAKIAGAEASGWVATLPVGRATTQLVEIDAGRPGVTETLEVDVNVVTSGYFQALRIPLVGGRMFNAGDGALAKPVVIVNDVLARRYFGPAAVGRHLRDPEGTEFEIVGVVRSGKYRTLQQAPEPMMYFSLTQRTPEFLHLLVRTSREVALVLTAMHDGMRSIDSGVIIQRSFTLDQHVKEMLTLDRLLTTVVAACGLAALVLATIGVYGVIDDRVRRRTPEIGLRVALGASRSEIRNLVFREGLYLTLTGAAAGVAFTVLLFRIVRTFVHGLPAIGIGDLAVVPVALILVVTGAATIPMRRALKVSPTIALRCD
jgi:predicted permease